ncbi:MAG: YebC/PmpR family DNA-binding transcriptional regulator [Chloroflexi bacterium]|nr:YebC/PmpR family DNA-binding transcriptional regulator [Chloroflexota bacterium]
MSGHSKWSTIKHKKAAEDAKRGKAFTRLTREIAVAAREGGGDPEFNPRLRLAIDKAKASNMPNDNIDRAVKRGAGVGDDTVVYEELTYEGYGPNGVAFIVDTVTDNRNRTLAEVKHAFNKAGGSLATANAVLWQFDQKGYIELATDGVDFDELFLQAAEAGAEDVIEEEDTYVIYTVRESLHEVEQALSEAAYTITDSKLTWVPKNEVELPRDQAMQIVRLHERLDELDDVQNVSNNLSLSDEVLAELAEA